MGKRRIRLLKTMRDDLTIIGIDNDTKRMCSAAEEYAIECFENLDTINKDLDCAFVCTPPQFHAGITRECLERNLHVFSEINLIDDLYDSNCQLARQKGKVLFLSSTPLYKREIQIINDRVKQSGTACAYQYHIGQYLPDWHPWDNLDNFFVSRRATNGCRELLAIELPWVLHTFGRIETIHTVKKNLLDLGLDFPDTYLIQIEHEGGNTGSLAVDVVSRQAVRRLEVFSEKLYIQWNGTADSFYEKDIKTGKLNRIAAGGYKREKGYSELINEYAYLAEIEEFFKVIKGKEPLYSFEKDKETIRIIDEIER